MSKRKTEKDYKKVGLNRLPDKNVLVIPKNVKIKTWWCCESCGYKWQARYNDVQQGHGCPNCAGNIKKVIQDYFLLATTSNLIWCGVDLPENVVTLTRWKCKICGNIWKSRYADVYNGHGCPVCANNKKRNTEQKYYNVGKLTGIRWIGKFLPETVRIKTEWLCEKGHTWKTSYSKIQQGQGCPYCKDYVNGSPVSKPQRRLNEMLHGSLNYPEARYRIDVVIMRNSQKIAVEYDAQYWHQGNEEHDEKRDLYLLSKGWKVLHVKSEKLLPTRKQLKQAIKQLLKNKNNLTITLKDWK